VNRRDFVAGAIAGAVAGVVPAGAAAWGLNEARTRDRAAFDKERAEQPRRPPESRLSFSQQGEDIVLFHALRDTLKLETPTYLDVGAAHPIRSNNTYLLYGTGATGVLIEPNPAFVKLLREIRPRDKVVAAGIGVTDDQAADYYEIKGAPMLNTFSAEQADYLKKTGKEVERVTKMPLININRLIAEQLGRTPDLISTDIEGLDYAVIKSLDMSKHRPGVICAEGVPVFADGKQSDLATYLREHDYVVRGGSMVNTIFVDARRLKEA
jgi:FkbM family methyltransferase